MTEDIYIFLAEAVAGTLTDYRPGARHALILYVTAPSAETARSKVVEEVGRAGWLHARILRGGAVVRQLDAERHPVMQDAMEGARQTGAAMVIYTDEIRHNA
jgi:hypothetical protein